MTAAIALFRRRAVVLALAVLFDGVIGELPLRVHPVVWMGNAIALLRDRAPVKGPTARLLAGVLITVLLVTTAASAGWLLEQVGGALGVCLQALALTSSFAIRELAAAVMRVARPLEAGDLAAAKVAVSQIVSRDTTDLGASEVAAAGIQTVSENLCDSVVAPLFFYVLLGLPGALAYRAANTMDAMLGYRGTYEWLGKVPARLDDVLNWVPARLTAKMLLLWGGMTGRNGVWIWWRDHRLTPSPNGGHPMAAEAGLLGRRLVKPGVYALGDGPGPQGADVRIAVRDALVVSGMSVILALGGVHWLHQ